MLLLGNVLNKIMLLLGNNSKILPLIFVHFLFGMYFAVVFY